jgi:transposase
MSRRLYTTDFKAAAAKLVTEQGYGNKAAADSLGVPPSTLQHWVRRHGRARTAPPAAAADEPAALKAELGRLRDEVRRLTMEREILKKATAFFASERA